MKTVLVVGPHRLCQWWSWYGCVKGRWGLWIQGKGEGRLGRWLGKHHEVRFCIYFNFLVIVIANENFQVLGPSALNFFATSQFAAFEKQGALTGTKVLRQEDIGATQPCPARIYFSFFPNTCEVHSNNSFSVHRSLARVAGSWFVSSVGLVFLRPFPEFFCLRGRILCFLTRCRGFLWRF